MSISNTSKLNKVLDFLKPLARFAKSERGNVSMMAGLSIIPLLVSGGAAIDYVRGVNAGTILQASLDSAALYAAALPDTTNAALTSKSQIYIQQNYKNNGDAVLSNFTITINGPSVTATAKATLNNNFMSLVGIPTTVVSGSSTVLKSGINLEVSMVLDNTGSMGWINPQTGNTAITDLIPAAKKFVDLVMPATQGTFYTKIAAIPYNNSVRPPSAVELLAARGTYLPGTSTTPGYANLKFTNMNNQQVTAPISQCVTERVGLQAATDVSAAIAPLGRQYTNGTDPCSVTPYVPLSTSAATLKTTIGNMSASNFTAGQVGVAWGWYTLSPNIGLFSTASTGAPYSTVPSSPSYDPATPYAKRTRKIMVLMTDGEYNSAYADGVFSGQLPAYSNYINYTQSDVNKKAPDNNYAIPQATTICGAIKAKGIEVYVITFQLDPTHAERVGLINSCATDAAHVIDADHTSLDAAFSKIANNINSIRITN